MISNGVFARMGSPCESLQLVSVVFCQALLLACSASPSFCMCGHGVHTVGSIYHLDEDI